MSSDFKMPQIFRTSLGFDKRIATSPFTVSADILYTKDMQGVYQFGANRKDATQKMYDGRDYYANAAAYTFNSLLGGNSGSVLSNTTMGHSFNFTVGVNMAPKKGFFGSLFYSHTTAKTTTDNQGSNASSAWGATPNINNPNDLFLASSIDALPHRVVGTISYRKEYFNHLATTVSLYYNGASQGRYSFTYNGDVNGDAIAGDLLFIPNNGSDVNFVANTVSYTENKVTKTRTFTPEEQKAAFEQLIANTAYLNDNRGKIAERNGVLMPWLNRFDAKLLQDLFTNIGKNRNTLQFSLDIVNFGNMLNSNWGIQKVRTANTNTPLSVATRGENPTFRMNVFTPSGAVVPELPTTMYQDVRTVGTTWSMQIGLRYLFN
ncbi:hypothetical protein [Niabella hibiscisoli]|uniref:hypothetical protein n=1 Tax=Niabella hibiscisoli TaxID=1825928 RepID=UPI001F0FA4C2|nr:hypothetical protein [Niabella hibiscisoli]MCH5717527.1 hypothetical protein [Niabella hibiscisoli]